MPCPKCNDTGWFQYDSRPGGHSQPCYVCCKHDQGYWLLSDEFYGYVEGVDTWCCLAGCGHTRTDKPELTFTQ